MGSTWTVSFEGFPEAVPTYPTRRYLSPSVCRVDSRPSPPWLSPLGLGKWNDNAWREPRLDQARRILPFCTLTCLGNNLALDPWWCAAHISGPSGRIKNMLVWAVTEIYIACDGFT